MITALDVVGRCKEEVRGSLFFKRSYDNHGVRTLNHVNRQENLERFILEADRFANESGSNVVLYKTDNGELAGIAVESYPENYGCGNLEAFLVLSAARMSVDGDKQAHMLELAKSGS